MKHKRFTALLLAVALLAGVASAAPFTASAAPAQEQTAANSGTTGDCTWTLDGTVLTISGSGAMGNFSSTLGIHLKWGTNITKVIIEDGVTYIGKYAFSGCSKLKTVIIPDSVTSIAANAFSNCANAVIYAEPDSYAATYAADKGISFQPVSGTTGECTWRLDDTVLAA